ncbi:hypothetical protein [Haloarcula amylolytica]|uniref:hypothetical protein n=1 Tax=Haloarcula amylolytica TaxID=396317 RepID=UPI003C75F5FD
MSIEGLRCEFKTFDDHIETGYEESPPRRVSEFMENTDGISVDPMATNLEDYIVDHSRRKYLEQTLEPGDQLSVIGSAVPRREDIESAAYPRDLVVTQTDETALQLSEQSYDNIADGGSALLVSALTSISGIALLILWAIL